MMLEGKRKLIFFIAVLCVAGLKLSGTDLADVLSMAVLAFAGANGVEHYAKGKKNDKPA